MEIESIQYDYKKGSGSMDDQENITADEIKYKTVKKDKNEKDYEECKTIWIYRMHKDAFLLRNIKKIISSNTDSRQNRTIYFSIDMNSLFDNDTLKYEEIEKLRQDFQEYVLIIKNEKINLNLLYH